MAVANLTIIVNAIFFLGMGLVALIYPASIPGYFSVRDVTPGFRNEVRAVCGGFGGFIAGLLTYAHFFDSAPNGIIFTVGIALFGMAFGRLCSTLIEKEMGFWPSVFFARRVVIGQ